MATVAKQIYRKGLKLRLVTTDAEATAAVAAGFTAAEKVDERPSTKGTTATRPLPAVAGAAFAYFDTTLGKPTWVNAAATGYVDATGTAV